MPKKSYFNKNKKSNRNSPEELQLIELLSSETAKDQRVIEKDIKYNKRNNFSLLDGNILSDYQ